MSSDKEDGEIEDGEIDSEDEPMVVDVKPSPEPKKPNPVPVPEKRQNSNQNHGGSKARGSANKEPADDDWAMNIEKAIANALKKDGVEPPLPNIAMKEPERPAPMPRSKRRKKPKSERKRNKQLREEEEKKKNEQSQTQTAPPPGELTVQTALDLIDADVDEYEMLGMRGGSPPPQTANLSNPAETQFESDAESSSNRSIDSEDHANKNTANNRGQQAFNDRKRRRNRSRSKSRERTDNKKRTRNERRNRSRDRRDRRRSRSRSEEERREPRKMEICKFYLLDCCAKRDKCSYLHSEYPCKYYYLGMDCPAGKDCKLNHGKPLTSEFRGLLLKHLETAPKEILGDFPRMPRDKSLKLMDAAHLNLLRIQRGEAPVENKIPSLLDGMDERRRKDQKDNKNRRSRWCDIPPAPELPEESPKDQKVTEEPKKEQVEQISVRKLESVLTTKQIDDMIAMGIESIDQIKQLTLAQMTELGLSIAQISEIQTKSLNLQKEVEDVDLRVPPSEPQDVDLREKDIDLRVLPPSTSVPVVTAPRETPSYGKFVDYSQYLRDSHVAAQEEDPQGLKMDDTPVEDEPELQIDESWCEEDRSEDEDMREKQKSKVSSSFSSSAETENVIMSPNHTQESLIATLKELEKARLSQAESSPVPQPSSSPASYNPSMDFMSFYGSKEEQKPRRPSINEIKSPSNDGGSEDELPQRPSIYDLGSDVEDDAKVERKCDKDLRILLDNTGDDGTGDIDLRLPFKPIMAHYIPATEIDGSIASHMPIDYKLFEVEIPKPNFNELRRNKTAGPNENVLDPRLRRLLGVRNRRASREEVQMPPPIASPDPISSKPVPVSPVTPRSDPRDPRRRGRVEEPPALKSQKDPNQLDMQQLMIMLQKSAWYQDLSSNNKIMVNQQLATLSGDLKRFHADPSSEKTFDLSAVTTNPFISVVLTNLGVFLNENGYFCHVEDSKEPVSVAQNPGVPNLASLMATPPPNLLTVGSIPTGIDLNLLRPLLANATAQAAFRPGILNLPPPLVTNPLLNEQLIRSFLPPPVNNFPAMGMGGGGNQRNDMFRDQGRQQDNRRNWVGNNNRNNRHQRRRN